MCVAGPGRGPCHPCVLRRTEWDEKPKRLKKSEIMVDSADLNDRLDGLVYPAAHALRVGRHGCGLALSRSRTAVDFETVMASHPLRNTVIQAANSACLAKPLVTDGQEAPALVRCSG